jgi:hypothetical protein
MFGYIGEKSTPDRGHKNLADVNKWALHLGVGKFGSQVKQKVFHGGETLAK